MHDVLKELVTWVRQNPADEKCLWSRGWEEQLLFLTDDFPSLFFRGLLSRPSEAHEGCSIRVIGTHRSKSLVLPVVSYERPGLQVVVRHNFYDWKATFVSTEEVTAKFGPLFTNSLMSPVYFEGFPEKLVFEPWSVHNRMRWSAEVRSSYELYTTLFLVLRALDMLPLEVRS